MLFIITFIAICIIINALYVSAEFATVSVRRSAVQHLASEGHKTAKSFLPIIENPILLDRYVATCQIGITLSSIMLGAVAQQSLTDDFIPVLQAWFSISYDSAMSISVVVILIILTALQMVLGELVPKSLSLQYSLKAALLTFIPLRWSMWAFSKAVDFLNGSGNLLLKLSGLDNSTHRQIHSPEELLILIAESKDGGALEPEEHERLRRALHLGSHRASDLLIPRTQMVAIDVDSPIEQVMRIISESPYTRFPVYRRTSDNVIGLVHSKDVVRNYLSKQQLPISALLKPIPAVPASVSAEKILTLLRRRKAHQAVVIDEFGSVDGIVSLTDVLRDVIGGGISDEFKTEGRDPETLPDGRVRLPGFFRLDEAEPWIGVLWSGDAHTVAGKVMEALGAVPNMGQKIEIDGVQIEVERVKRNKIISILAKPRQKEDAKGNQQ